MKIPTPAFDVWCLKRRNSGLCFLTSGKKKENSLQFSASKEIIIQPLIFGLRKAEQNIKAKNDKGGSDKGMRSPRRNNRAAATENAAE